MDKKLKQQLEQIVRSVSIPHTIKYICVCKASTMLAEREKKKPHFLQSKSSLTVNIWLMPELSIGLENQFACRQACDEMNQILGDGYNVEVCPTKSELIMQYKDYCMTINN